MWTVLFVLYVAGFTGANIVCSDPSNAGVTFKKSNDLGRYTAQICTKVNRNFTKWNVDLLYNDRARYCTNKHHEKALGKSHSEITFTDINKKITELNCTFVCMSINFEMIFQSCYLIKSTLFVNEKDMPPYDTYHNITNNFTKNSFQDSIVSLYNAKGLTLYSYAVAPSTSYIVELCPLNNTVGTVECPTVTENCTRSSPDSVLVRCELSPPYGCYMAWVIYNAPWSNGHYVLNSRIHHKFCWNATLADQVRVNGADWSAAWACGIVLLLSGAALLVWRMRDAIALHKRVLKYWTEHSQESRASRVEAGAESEQAACRHILLVYAREGPAGQAVARAVRDALRQCSGAAVHDVFSPETMAAAAAGGAPCEWVRAMVARPDCRLLVLQTPAIACLHAAPRPAAADGAPVTLSEPLLGRHAVYREPQFGDALTQYALRLLTHSEAQQQPHPHLDRHALPAYKKYFLATLTELPTEVLPQVCPFRRYALPEAMPLLAEQMGARGAVPAAALQRLQAAARDFARAAAERPDYLLDELVFI